VRKFSSVLSGRDAFAARFPATMWLANFRLSLRDKGKPRKPLVEKLERFVKFKPQTPLREIIRLTAK
jgi:hypothetical protein